MILRNRSHHKSQFVLNHENENMNHTDSKRKVFKMQKNPSALVAEIFEPALQVTEITSTTVAIASGLTKIFASRFEKGLEVRNNLKEAFEKAEVDTVKRHSMFKRILAKDVELEILRNFYTLCMEAEQELKANLPEDVKVDTNSIGDMAGLNEMISPSQDS